MNQSTLKLVGNNYQIEENIGNFICFIWFIIKNAPDNLCDLMHPLLGDLTVYNLRNNFKKYEDTETKGPDRNR